MYLLSNEKVRIPFKQMTQLLHFLRLHQMVYQITLMVSILFFQPTADVFDLITAIIMILFITPTFLLIQDLLGKKDDEKANQKRIIFSEKLNKLFFVFSMVLMITILILNSMQSVFCFVLLFICTFSYAIAKHFRKMILSYVFRYLSSVFTVLLYTFILANGLYTNYFLFICIVSILDLTGNIAGDIRDMDKDTKAGVITLVSTFGMSNTLQFMAFLLITFFGILIIIRHSLLILGLLILNIVQFVSIDQLPVKFTHGIFHLGKLINFLVISAVLNTFSLLLLGIITFLIVSLWLISYYFYLYNTGVSTHA